MPELNELLGEEYRDNPALQDFKDVDGLAKAFMDTKSMVGKMVRIPGEDAAEDDVSAFRQKLLDTNLGVVPMPDWDDPDATKAFFQKIGMPEDTTGYSEIEGMPAERRDFLAKLAHDAGITDKQFKKVAEGMMQVDGAAAESVKTKRAEAVNQLKTEWGEAFSQKLARVQRLAEATKAPEGLIEALKSGGIDAATLRWMDAVANSIGGEGAELKDDLGDVDSDTRTELEAKRDELTRKIMNENLPPAEHQRLVAKLVGYNEKLAAAG